MPIRIAFAQLAAAVGLLRLAISVHHRDPILARVAARASRYSLAPSTTRSAAFFWIGQNISRTWHPRALLTLYEGHAWEKCMWLGVNTTESRCTTVAYQHGPIFEHSLSIIEPDADPRPHSSPDVVLCSGPSTAKLLAPGHRGPGTPLVVFGSYRRPARAGERQAPRPNRRTVLVVPEGYRDESVALFDCAMNTARLLPDHRFILRCNPLLPIDAVRPYLPHAPEEQLNVEVSGDTNIDGDIARASVALYRGSTAVFAAVLGGLKPVYLEDARLGNRDPLFTFKGWRDQVSSPPDLAMVLRQYAQATSDQVHDAWSVAADDVEAYAAPVNDASIERLLSEIAH